MKQRNDHRAPRTGHAPFDKATTSIIDGNVSGDTQMGAFIRPFTETRRGPLTFAEGELRDSDLRIFREYLGMTPAIEAEVKDLLVDRTGILYAFFSPDEDGERTVHGMVLTGTGADFHEPLGRWTIEDAPHAGVILDRMQDYLTYPAGTREKAGAAVEAAVARLSEAGNPEVDALVSLAREAEGAFPNFGAWRVLKDVGDNDWQAMPPALQRFEPAISLIQEADPKLFNRARIAIANALEDLYDATFGQGTYVDSVSAMRLVRDLVNDYPEPAPGPTP